MTIPDPFALVPVEDDPGPVPETVTTTPLVPMLAGTFAIYQHTDGGFVLVADTDGTVTRRHIPGAMVRMLTGGGMFAKKFSGIFGGTVDELTPE